MVTRRGDLCDTFTSRVACHIAVRRASIMFVSDCPEMLLGEKECLLAHVALKRDALATLRHPSWNSMSVLVSEFARRSALPMQIAQSPVSSNSIGSVDSCLDAIAPHHACMYFLSGFSLLI